jgi:hypothetical protein
VQGVTRSLGVRLGGIVIPELRLRLPSLELPCCYRTHEGARMMIESAEAPWVSTGVETVRVGGGAVAEGSRQRSTDDADAASRSAPEADCEGAKREYEEKLQELQRKVDDCEQLKRCLQDCLNDYQRKSTDAAAQQNDNDVPVKLPNPDPTPSDSRVFMPQVVQPAGFDAVPISPHQPARLIRLPTVQEPRPLPQP